MTIDLDALEKLADEATPGDWFATADDQEPEWNVRQSTDGLLVAALTYSDFTLQQDARNAAFIAAANPATIKALIAELKEAREHLARCVELVPAPGAIEAADAFLARNGKGEG